MQRSLGLNLLLSTLLCALLACSKGLPDEAPKPAADATPTTATAPKEAPTFSSGFETGDTSDWSKTRSEAGDTDEAEETN